MKLMVAMVLSGAGLFFGLVCDILGNRRPAEVPTTTHAEPTPPFS